MSWRTWLQATAIRLGISEQGSIPVETALENLRFLEDRANTLRASLLEASAGRRLFVEEVTAYDVARGNLYATTTVIHKELIRMGVPAAQLPMVVMLAPLPASALQGVTLAPSGAGVRGTSLGAIRLGPSGARPSMFTSGPDTVGVLKGLTVGVAVQYALIVIGILSLVALAHYLVQLMSPEIALQQSVTEHDLGVAENLRDVLTEYENTRQAALAAGQDPNSITPPDVSAFNTLATGNPLATGISSVKSIVVALFGIGALIVGWKIYKDRREG